MGVHPGVYWPSQATWFSASRSMLRSSASRTRGSLASGVPRSTGGVFFPFLLWRLMVMLVVVEAGDAGQVEPALLLQAGGVGRRDQVHHVDVARAQIGQPHVVVRDDPEHDPVELGLARIEVVLGLLQDDPVLRDALHELPGAHADGGGAELVARASWPGSARPACPLDRRGWPGSGRTAPSSGDAPSWDRPPRWRRPTPARSGEQSPSW